MLIQKQPLVRGLRRGQTSLALNNATLSSSSSSSSSSWIHFRSVLFIVSSSSLNPMPVSSDRGSLKSPWSRRRGKHSLLAKQWKGLFDVDGKLSDGGVKFLKKIRTGGIEPSIRAEVWPFLLGVYDVKSSKEERRTIRAQKRRDYFALRKQCRQISRRGEKRNKSKETSSDDNGDSDQVSYSQNLDEVSSASVSCELTSQDGRSSSLYSSTELTEQQKDDENASDDETPSLYSDSSEDPEDMEPPLIESEDNVHPYEPGTTTCNREDFSTWQRIMRIDAIRADDEWVVFSPSQASVSLKKARQLAESVGLKDYDHLEACRIHHAARLVAILEAYAVYDPEIGYCQGMSDLLSPIISVMEDDHIAFWCFVGFMQKARHNFRLDEAGIKRQLNVVSRIIKCKDSLLYRHLEKLRAEDCFFVYRMVVVLFRRELSFEQTLSLWEVMWADQAAIRAGIVKSAWRRMRLRAPPVEDLLLYAIAACVLQKRKLIIEKHCSVDEIMKECNDMAGNLDVWKLLDDAHDLVVTLHDKI
ncbi:hypothetical protein M569_12369 [Genlisea aurea]|uniref:Rab-GAP TBC domain-containing protein n=1 Tax=Genlisea aurea TaxID=192259 RepID=S8DI51_9LAMI|nr:hypothetical protein M569_12369 [Genlisea aurea]